MSILLGAMLINPSRFSAPSCGGFYLNGSEIQWILYKFVFQMYYFKICDEFQV